MLTKWIKIISTSLDARNKWCFWCKCFQCLSECMRWVFDYAVTSSKATEYITQTITRRGLCKETKVVFQPRHSSKLAEFKLPVRNVGEKIFGLPFFFKSHLHCISYLYLALPPCLSFLEIFAIISCCCLYLKTLSSWNLCPSAFTNCMQALLASPFRRGRSSSLDLISGQDLTVISATAKIHNGNAVHLTWRVHRSRTPLCLTQSQVQALEGFKPRSHGNVEAGRERFRYVRILQKVYEEGHCIISMQHDGRQKTCEIAITHEIRCTSQRLCLQR